MKMVDHSFPAFRLKAFFDLVVLRLMGQPYILNMLMIWNFLC